MKKLLILVIMLLVCPFISACGNDHEHDWSVWRDNYDGTTHTRVCKDNLLHKEDAEHVWNQGEILKEVTDLQNGIVKYTCVECGFNYQKILPPTGDHNFTEEIADSDHLCRDISSATKIYYKTCADCGAFGNDQFLFEKTVLPDNYLEVEYIKSTGYQYIDTGYKANGDTHIIVKALYTSHFSLYGGTPGFMNFTAQENTKQGYFYYDGYDTGASSKGNYVNKVHVFEQNKNICLVDGKQIHEFDYSTKVDSNNLFLFGRNDNGNLHDNGGEIKLYYCKIYDDGELIRDYVPVFNVIIKEYGLYDIVNAKFYTYEYQFKCGETININNLPAGYTEVEYIESNGNQCIDTGITEMAIWELDVQFKPMNLRQLMGYSEHNADYWGVQKDETYGLWLGNTTVVSGNRDIVVHDYESSLKTLSVNGEKVLNIIQDGFEPSGSYKLFSLTTGTTWACHMKLYSCKTRINGELVRHFVPCIEYESGKAGLYDIINNKFYSSVDKGLFEGGKFSGHDFDDGVTVQEANFNQDGEVVYTCKICGKEIHEMIDKFAFKVEFEIDEGIEGIKIFKDYDPNNYENTLTAYTRNENTFNYSKVDGIVIYEVVLKEGYIINTSYFSDTSVTVTKVEDRYVISNIRSDLEIKIESIKATPTQ